MWINDGIIEKHINSEIIPDGFIKGRLKKQKKIDKLILNISKEDLFNYYIVENHSYIETMEYFNINIRADLRNLLKYYSIAKDKKLSAIYAKKVIKSEEEYKRIAKKSAETQKKNWKAKSDLEKKQWSEKCKVSHNTEAFKQKISEINKSYFKNLPDEIKRQRNIERSKTCKKTWSNPEIIKKQQDTINKNKQLKGKSLFKSIIEEKIYNNLKKYYNDIQYNIFVDNRYPFYCDFYIKSLDLFIEFQGHPSHGKRPFDKDNIESLEEAYKLYGSWRDTFINRDVNKYNIAKQNNINLLRIYPEISIDENYKINNFRFIDIIQIIFNTLK